MTRLCYRVSDIKKIEIDGNDLVYKYIRGSGPGG